MKWHPDVPDYSIKKPKELEHLEKLSSDILNAMTPVELGEKIQDAADGLVRNYAEAAKDAGTFDECTLLVSGALGQTGGAIDGKAGAILVAKSDAAAQKACREYFPEEKPAGDLDF